MSKDMNRKLSYLLLTSCI